MQANRARLSIYPQYVFSPLPTSAWPHSRDLAWCLTFPSLTQANDTINFRVAFALLFSAVKETIMQNALEASGVM